MTARLDPIEKALRQVQRSHVGSPKRCPYPATFCAWCPDAPGLACVVRGLVTSCEEMTHYSIYTRRWEQCQYAGGCACCQLPTTKRKAAYESWRARRKRNKYLVEVVERPIRDTRRQLRREDKRVAEGQKRRPRRAVCADCGTPITGAGRTPYCRRCVRFHIGEGLQEGKHE